VTAPPGAGHPPLLRRLVEELLLPLLREGELWFRVGVHHGLFLPFEPASSFVE
jgi:hypothetical protein